VAIDIAEAAAEATQDNARRNGVSDRISASTVEIADVDGTYDLVVANVLAPPLVAMADDLRRLTAPDGCLVVSGVLTDHHGHVLEALEPMVAVATDDLEGWASVELRHR
jgi:ribosomal protein L11 methyltransferase